MAHDIKGAGLEIKELRLNQLSALDDVLHIAVGEDLAGYSFGLVEEDGVINNLADRELLVVVDHSHMSCSLYGAVVEVQNALELGKPTWGRSYQ